MSTKNIVYIALIAALAVTSPILMPLKSVPMTAQSLGPMLPGSILNAQAALLFISMISIVLPIMAGGCGSIGVIIGPSGGFIGEFPLAAFIIDLLF